MKRSSVLCVAVCLVASTIASFSSTATAATGGKPVEGCADGLPANYAAETAPKVVPHCEKGSPAPVPLKDPVDLIVSMTSKASANSAAMLLAADKGEFKKENLNVTIQLASGPDASALMAQGKIDATINYDASSLNLIASGFGFKMAMAGWYQTAESFDGIWCKASIKTFKDLKGKTVAGSNPASNAFLSLYAGLKSAGLGWSDIRFNQVANAADGTVALQNGAADCAGAVSPFYVDLLNNSSYRFLTPFYPAAEPGAGVLLGPNMYKPGMRPVRAAFARAYVRTISTYFQGDYKRNPNTLNDLVRVSGSTAASILGTPSYVWDYVVRDDTLAKVQKMFRDQNALSYPKNLPLKKMLDRTVLTDALRPSRT